MPPSPEEFSRRFRRLSAEERAAFVADLSSARGWDVERDGTRLVASKNGATRVVAVGTPPDHADADEVVAVPSRVRRLGRAVPGDGAVDGAVLEPVDLHERLLYGLDRGTAADLFETHFGVAFERDPPGPTRPRLSVVVPAAVLALVLLAALLVGWTGVVFSPGADPPEEETGTAADRFGEPPNESATLPPGVSRDGLRAVDPLVAAHLRTAREAPGVAMDARFAGPRFLTGFDTFRSGYDADDEVVVRVRARNDSRYRVVRQLRFPGDLASDAEATLELFADGTAEYRRLETGGTASYDRRPLSATRNGSDEIAGWTRTVVPRYLNTTESRVEPLANGTGPYRIVATGEPRRLDHDARDYRAVALVTGRGFIAELLVTYAHPETGATVRVTVRYDRSGVAVTSPEWYGTALARTDGRSRAVDGRTQHPYPQLPESG